ncbi:periplasmic protein [Aquisphaera giovannonii]|uniref:Periplasmic protein n=1 Tax=Aquisphaera giovannonii TaxID=406548 RepID=A0A5B9VXB4_9BACT|nr:BON domain-containing protein [Aquisphaera giovannonii]QEH32724.1 periplasmic protein [Aquisphaera giovannonii]
MKRLLPAFVVATALVGTPALAQDGPLNRVGRALDNAGRNVRNRVETEVARGQAYAEERDLLYRVTRRLDWDKPLVGSTIRIEIRPDSSVVLRGSVLTEDGKKRAVDLVANTVGVGTVVDELAVVKGVKVIESTPAVVVPPPGDVKVVTPKTRTTVVTPPVEVKVEEKP